MKWALRAGVEYALQRRQFGKAVSELGLVREKLARSAAQTYATARDEGEMPQVQAVARLDEELSGPGAGQRSPSCPWVGLRPSGAAWRWRSAYGVSSLIAARCASKSCRLFWNQLATRSPGEGQHSLPVRRVCIFLTGDG